MDDFRRSPVDNKVVVVEPITGLCIVSAAASRPLGYNCIDKSYDQQKDTDLWKDGWRKKTRYLCLTRFFPLDDGRLNNVVDAIDIVGERDEIPPGFAPVNYTTDTNKKALKDKIVIVKMVPRYSVKDAICELIVLSGMKRAPDGYTSFGTINDLLLCFRKGPVPPACVKSMNPVLPGRSYMLQQADVLPSPQKNAGDAENGNSERRSSVGKILSKEEFPALVVESVAGTGTPRPSVVTQTGASLARQSTRNLGFSTSVPVRSLIDDIPFKVSSSISNVTRLRTMVVPSVSYQSLNEIKRQYDYNFQVETAYLASCDRSEEEP